MQRITTKDTQESARRTWDEAKGVECIVPFDFTDASRRALRWAVSIARGARVPMRIALVHAIEPTALGESDDFRALLEARGRERMLAECDGLAPRGARGGVAIVRECEVGDLVDLVRSRAGRAPRALVVVGDRGLGAVRRAILGSATERLLRELECPMLVVRSEPERDAPPAVRAVLVATDFSRDAEAALEAAHLLCDAATPVDGAVRVEFVHVVSPAPLLEVSERASLTATPAQAPVPAPELPPAEVAIAEAGIARALEDAAQAFRAAARAAGAEVEVATRIEHGDLVRALAHEADRTAASVIVLGRHAVGMLERMLTGSTAERLVHATRRSVLTARAPAPR
ncbi:MAG: hypothetical protein GC172_03850 [Phycisphaera sp.]|nr:hypothetical protein [Phycisphaera sp.]